MTEKKKNQLLEALDNLLAYIEKIEVCIHNLTINIDGKEVLKNK